ncbi:MAG: glycosyl transferase [Deltaproteobacteria bacterium]|nr:glycosyl transferase [Deltaproteobacteria bacterium]
MNNLLTLVSFLTCLILTPAIRQIAVKRGWIALPSKERWHKKPTALLGGIAIYIAAAGPLFFIADFDTLLPHLLRMTEVDQPPSIAAALWIGMTLIFLLGLLDDFIHIKPHTKLVGQILVASLTTFLGFRLNWFSSLTLDTTLSIVWIVGITNAFNLIDNMDGLCTGIGLVAAAYLAYLFQGSAPDAGSAAMLLMGALGAFLLYNFSPASIFMGDSGSLMIGYTLSMLAMYYADTASAARVAAYAVPIMTLMVPILDISLVTMIRLLSGRKASVGGKDHTSHRLVIMGLTERGAVLFLYLIGAISGSAAVFVSKSDGLTSPAVIIPVGLAFILMGVYLAQLRIYPEKEFSLLRNRPYTPVLLEFTYKKQLLLVILDFGLVAFSYYLSYRLRFDQSIFTEYFKIFLRSLPAVIACKLLAFFIIGVYRGIWGHMSTNDVFVHLKAATLGTILSLAVLTYIYRLEGFSKGVFVIDWLLTTGLLLGTRGSFRIFLDTWKRKTLSGHDVLIYGAGKGGEILLRELLNNQSLGLKPVGFIDDDILKNGKKLLGYPILGSFQELETVVKKHRPTGLLISFNHANGRPFDTIADKCHENGLFVRKFAIHLVDMMKN